MKTNFVKDFFEFAKRKNKNFILSLLIVFIATFFGSTFIPIIREVNIILGYIFLILFILSSFISLFYIRKNCSEYNREFQKKDYQFLYCFSLIAIPGIVLTVVFAIFKAFDIFAFSEGFFGIVALILYFLTILVSVYYDQIFKGFKTK